MKESSVASQQMQLDLIDRLSPLQKIISTENLSYIPNLYFRKYKLIESLNHQRFDFPQQKILLPRPKTSWDAVLCEMKQKSQLRKQIQKFKIAQNYHVVKNAKEDFIKKELKKEQRQLFHRIFANQLAEDVQSYFKTYNNVAPVQTNGQSQEEKNNQAQNKKNQSLNKTRGMDDIFIDKQPEEDYMGADNGGQIDFFDDILNDGVPSKSPLDLINQPSRLVDQAAPQRTIKDYVDSFNKMNEKQEDNKMEQQIIDPASTHISRKACLKRINENLRRRLKSKGAETQDRSLTSATVALSNLINNYPECKQNDNFIQIPSQTQWIFDDNVRNKKRREQDFQLNWDEQEIERFQSMNDKFQFSKIKQMPSILQLTLQRNQYVKLFERNIATNYNFPSNIESIKKFSSKFNKQRFYYNEFFDEEYERFIRKNNKRKLLQKFQKNSNHMFAQHYVQNEIGNDERIGVGKMFLYSPTKISDRLIYKVTPGTTKISIVAKQYNKKNIPLSRQKIILLSYLVNRYLTEFGNNWKTITEFIQIFPCFSNYLIKPELVQQLYQMINRHELKSNHLQNLQIWDKKLLPANQLYNGSYKDFAKIVKQKSLNKKPQKGFDMVDQSQTSCGSESEESNNFSLENYQDFIKQPLQPKTQKKSLFQNLSKKYKQYGQTLCAKTTNEIYNFYENKVRKANKIIEEYRNTYGVTKIDSTQKHQNQDKIQQYVQQNMKGQVKYGHPFKKKKNINQRNNELVKILQALRSKNTGNMPPPGPQKGATQVNKPVSSGQTKTPPNISTSTPTPQQPSSSIVPPINQTVPPKPVQAPSDKQQKKSKTPQKRVSGAAVPNSKKNKKKQGEQQKEKK